MTDKPKQCFNNSNQYKAKAHHIIPGGCHTYSKGIDQFPLNAPSFIKRGKGGRIIDLDNNEFVDWGMGLTSVILGHANEEVNNAITEELKNGISFIRPSFIEAEVAELIVNQINSAEMVKFAKNGSDATSAAVRLSRAFTGNDLILRCADHPFFSVNDWFIGDTAINSGIPNAIREMTKSFKYNDINNFKEVVAQYKDRGIACAILQPQMNVLPDKGYLQALKDECDINGIILIFDEIVTGFRYHPKGAQHVFKVRPHLTTLGKSMGNGFSISALVGKREIMELGGLNHKKERVFLLSTTYGAETHHLRATQKVIEILNRNDYEVSKHIWNVGESMVSAFNSLAEQFEITDFAQMSGVGCKPFFIFRDGHGNPDSVLRTLFLQEMITKGVLVQGLIPSFAHGQSEMDQTVDAFEHALKVLARAIQEKKVNEYLIGPTVKAVFRKFN